MVFVFQGAPPPFLACQTIAYLCTTCCTYAPNLRPCVCVCVCLSVCGWVCTTPPPSVCTCAACPLQLLMTYAQCLPSQPRACSLHGRATHSIPTLACSQQWWDGGLLEPREFGPGFPCTPCHHIWEDMCLLRSRALRRQGQLGFDGAGSFNLPQQPPLPPLPL